MLWFVEDGNWSAFEHTLTSLDSGALNDSFLGLAAWNSRKEASNEGNHMPNVHKECCFTSPRMHEQIPRISENGVNSSRSTLFQKSSCPNIVIVNNDSNSACVEQGLSLTSAISQQPARNSFDIVSVSSSDAGMLKDVNCLTVSSKVGEHNVKDSRQSSQTQDMFTVNKPVRGKENIQPSELPKPTARKQLDWERRSVNTLSPSITSKHSVRHIRSRHSGSISQWTLPLQRSVNNAVNMSLQQSELLAHHASKVCPVIDTADQSFSALSVVSSDSADSSVDQHSPDKPSGNGLNSHSGEVYKRSSSTPVKDQDQNQLIRFRHQECSSPDETGKKRKSPMQYSVEVLEPASELGKQVRQLNEQCSSTPATQSGLVTQTGDSRFALDTARLSHGALSTGSLPDDSLLAGSTMYESTILLSLPANINVESVHDTSCSEVGTQTSFLLPTNNRKTRIPKVSGNCLLQWFMDAM